VETPALQDFTLSPSATPPADLVSTLGSLVSALTLGHVVAPSALAAEFRAASGAADALLKACEERRLGQDEQLRFSHAFAQADTHVRALVHDLQSTTGNHGRKALEELAPRMRALRDVLEAAWAFVLGRPPADAQPSPSAEPNSSDDPSSTAPEAPVSPEDALALQTVLEGVSKAVADLAPSGAAPAPAPARRLSFGQFCKERSKRFFRSVLLSGSHPLPTQSVRPGAR